MNHHPPNRRFALGSALWLTAHPVMALWTQISPHGPSCSIATHHSLISASPLPSFCLAGFFVTTYQPTLNSSIFTQIGSTLLLNERRLSLPVMPPTYATMTSLLDLSYH